MILDHHHHHHHHHRHHRLRRKMKQHHIETKDKNISHKNRMFYTEDYCNFIYLKIFHFGFRFL